VDEAVTVFITNLSPKHDYSAAVRYGAHRPVTSGNYPVFKTDRLVEEIVRALMYSSEDDYLLFSGSSFIGGLCLQIWLSLHKHCKVLLRDSRQNSYVPRLIRRGDLITQIEHAKDQLKRQAVR